jgi:hypothetical protein
MYHNPPMSLDPPPMSLDEEKDIISQIVKSIKHGYIKKPWSTVSPRGHITLRCKIKYQKYGSRAMSYWKHASWQYAFKTLFITNNSTSCYKDPYLKVTSSGEDRIRSGVAAVLGEKIVENFCLQMMKAGQGADVHDAKRKHATNIARRHFREKALLAAKQGLSREELVEIVNEAIIDDVMTE